jgi:hypothetical protein
MGRNSGILGSKLASPPTALPILVLLSPGAPVSQRALLVELRQL